VRPWHGYAIAVALAGGLCAVEPAPADQQASQPTSQAEILHHALEVRLIPDRHELLAVDRMEVRALADDVQEAVFTLHGNLRVVLVAGQGPAGILPLSFQAVPGTGPAGAGQAVTVRFSRPLQTDETATLMWQYRGLINEPPREPRHLRFVTPSETAGHIGASGVYLSGETLWYPDLPGSLPTFALRAKTPGEWTVVTHGNQLARTVQDGVATADWEVADKTEALTLVANRFVTKQRGWKGIGIATYLFPDDAGLADDYLDASIKYLDVYTKLLGPYPFPKFAVVENFFASGLGMPSFTLLGSGIIKRHYTQPYALGHEIVHSWIGNAVFNAVEQGNWVEGLTTYLANYYYEELTGTPEQAREQRRMMLLGYAVHVRPEEDYPVGQFKRKTDQKDNAIGYQKSAMVFHMLRREIGEEPFWRGLRTLVARYRGAYAGWKDLERVFSETAGRELRWFFAQWVERPGAPPAVKDITSVRADPEYEIFRRIPREALPPMLNLFATDPTRAVIVPSGGSEPDRAPYIELAAQIASKDSSSTMQDDRHVEAVKGSLLVLGGPGVNRAAEWAMRGCGEAVRIGKDSVTVEGRTYNGPATAALLSCRHPDRPGQVVTLFYGATPAAAAKVARLLFFYGWQSYLVFQDGVVVARGDYAGSRDRETVVEP
jgi:aminopeptidase N